MAHNPYDFYHRLLQLILDNKQDEFKSIVEDFRLSQSFKISVVEKGNFGSFTGDDSLYSTILKIQDKDKSFYYFENMIKNGFNFFHNKNHIEYVEKYILPFELYKHWLFLMDFYPEIIFNSSQNTQDKPLLNCILIDSPSYMLNKHICNNFISIMTDSLNFQRLNPELIFNDSLTDTLKNKNIKVDYVFLFKNFCKNKSVIPYLTNKAECFFIAFFMADKEVKNAFFTLFGDNIYKFSYQGYNLAGYIYHHYLTVIHFISTFSATHKNDDVFLKKRFSFLDYVIDNPKMRPFLFQEKKETEDFYYYPNENLFYSYESINIDLNYRPFQIDYNFEYQDETGYTILHHLLINKHRDKNTLQFVEKVLFENKIDIYTVKNNQGNSLYDLFPESKKYAWHALTEKRKIDLIVEKNDNDSEANTVKKRL